MTGRMTKPGHFCWCDPDEFKECRLETSWDTKLWILTPSIKSKSSLWKFANGGLVDPAPEQNQRIKPENWASTETGLSYLHSRLVVTVDLILTRYILVQRRASACLSSLAMEPIALFKYVTPKVLNQLVIRRTTARVDVVQTCLGRDIYVCSRSSLFVPVFDLIWNRNQFLFGFRKQLSGAAFWAGHMAWGCQP